MLTLIALGIFVGLVMGLTGAGGGILAVPLLLTFMHLPFAQAVPIAMLAIAVAAGSGALLGLQAGQVRYRAALLMAVVGMLVTPLGIWLAQRTDHAILSAIFALVLLQVACRSICNRNPEIVDHEDVAMPCLVDRQTGRLIWNSGCTGSLLLSGALAGLLSGLIGVGGGFVIVPALQRLSVLSISSVMSTALTVVFLVSLSVVAGHVAMGQLPWALALPFAAAAMAGLALGRNWGKKLKPRQLGQGFGVIALLAALMLLYRAFA